MEIRDVLHGSILVESSERPIIDSRYFQRLRQIKQMGFAEHSYPGATHNRYIHSLGAMATATAAFDRIFSKSLPAVHRRYRKVVRLAALLHDVGHGPLSHTTEFAMPQVRELVLPDLGLSPRSRKATHEDYTLKIITDSALTPVLEKSSSPDGFSPRHIAALIEPKVHITDDFFTERVEGQPVSFRPILQQLISSELDADRMDYLRRDSLHAGVSYGQFDFSWLVGNLTCHLRDGKCYLALQHRALYSFEDFLLSRFHMFLMVYFHYKSVVYDSMLAEYFGSPGCDYAIPSDIEKYLEFNDAHLLSHLALSRNDWAKRITSQRPYRMLVELHSGIPATRTALVEQQRLKEKIAADLNDRGIHFLEATSTGELSKYFRSPKDPIFVRYDNHFSTPDFIPLEQCTDLFQRYSEKRLITRLYVSPEDYAACQTGVRAAPLPYSDPAL